MDLPVQERCSTSRAVRYGVALCSGTVALLLAVRIPAEWPLKLPLILFYALLIIASAWVGGFWPGLLATGFCTLGASYWLEPHGFFQISHPADLAGIVLFLLLGSVLSALGERVHQSMRRERASRERAETSAAVERAAGQIREDMLAMIAHDLRDPLGAIALSAEVISRASAAGANEEISRRAALVRRTVQRMNGLLRNLLDTTLIEAGGLSLDISAEPAESLLAEVAEIHADDARARNIQIRYEAPAGLPHLLCDRDRMLQVFTNLVKNALKFTPNGGQVTVYAGVSGAFVRFSVADTGTGIDADKLPRIFQRYFSERRTQGGGLGLGLFIAKAIVEAHQGTIEVDSKAGQGATFSFTVPAVERADARAPASPNVASTR
ncbi:sensor histidine kinase [Sorangium sp. So ce131]|uniref:sensor histidine kinase n=1 Tax=Sorangium sp. So ce131 TaxID=3133282 RepID=UPI003F5EB9A7